MITIKRIHSNLVRQVRDLIGDQLSDMSDNNGGTFKAVIKDTTVAMQDDTNPLPEYPFVVVDIMKSGRRLLTGKGVTPNDTIYVTTLREPLFKITCYGGDCSDILDRLQVLLEFDNKRVVVDDQLNENVDAQTKANSSVKVQYFTDIVEVPAFIETSFVNTAETTLKLGVESHLELPESSIIETVQGNLVIKRYEDDPDPIEVAIEAP